MVHAITIAAAVVLSGVAAASAQIDLTPKETFYEVEGRRYPCIAFHNGSQNVTYTPPGDWKLTGGGQKLLLLPPDKSQAGATIETVVARFPLPPATAANVKAYSEMAVGLLPPGASKVEVVEQSVCPMTIDGKSMIEVTFSYHLYSQPFRMNVLVMPMQKEQLRFLFSARAADYPELFNAFRRSLFSMQGL